MSRFTRISREISFTKSRKVLSFKNENILLLYFYLFKHQSKSLIPIFALLFNSESQNVNLHETSSHLTFMIYLSEKSHSSRENNFCTFV